MSHQDGGGCNGHHEHNFEDLENQQPEDVEFAEPSEEDVEFAEPSVEPSEEDVEFAESDETEEEMDLEE